MYRIGCLNIKNEFYDKTNYIEDLIKKYKLDYLCLQEVSVISDINKYNIYGNKRSILSNKTDEACKIISKYNYKLKKTYRLPWLNLEYIFTKRRKLIPRIATVIIDSNNICLINTHLSSSRIPKIQKKQIDKLISIINKYRNYPLILMGDFNINKDSLLFNYLKDNLNLEYLDNDKYTYSNRIIDHVFYSKDIIIKKTDVIDTSYFSDHNMIYFMFKK